jgi:hypothetical protein
VLPPSPEHRFKPKTPAIRGFQSDSNQNQSGIKVGPS